MKGFPLAEVAFVRVVEPVGLPTSAGSPIVRMVGPAGLSTSAVPSILEDHQEQESTRKVWAEDYLKQVVSRLKHEGTTLQIEVLIGRATESLSDYAGDNDIDLILIATHGRSGVTRWVRGSVADKILRSANVPVLMVRAPGTKGGI